MKNKDVAVLLIAFGRVDYARQTFESIKKAQPAKFYFYTNKGRADHPDECQRNEIVKSMAKEVDWPCEFKTWFRDEPVGVLDSIRLAIDWVFQNEEMAIVMEEDCVGAPSWYDFASEMLVRYKDDQRIWMIGGSNYAEDYNPLGYSYHFSRNFFINGWASWRDRWNKVPWGHLDYDKLIKSDAIASYYTSKRERDFHIDRVKTFGKKVEEDLCWDFAFWYTAVENFAFSITPFRHLVQNIGLEGVHQGLLAKLRGKSLKVPYNPITFWEKEIKDMRHPDVICPEKKFDDLVFKRWVSKMRVWYVEIPRKIYHIVKRTPLMSNKS